MAETEHDQERTEQATPKRQREAQEQGQILRSRELSTLVSMLTAAVGLLLFGEQMADQALRLLHDQLRVDRRELLEPAVMIDALAQALWIFLLMLAPILSVMLMASIAGSVALGGWSFSWQAATWKWERLNPLAGLQRIFGWHGLVELLKSLVKVLVLGWLAMAVLWTRVDDLTELGAESLPAAINHSLELLLWFFLAMVAGFAVIAAVDAPYQWWQYFRKLKMTREEIKQEAKEAEGNPEVRGRIRSLQRQAAQRRMMEDVPKAAVVVVNPIHYAVALQYNEHTQPVPVVIAKGTDQVALAIRERAEHHAVLVFPAPTLARALYHSTKIGESIPAGLYTAVAKVLAYVYQLRAVKQTGREEPVPPADLPVPTEYLERQPR